MTDDLVAEIARLRVECGEKDARIAELEAWLRDWLYHHRPEVESRMFLLDWLSRAESLLAGSDTPGDAT